MNCRTCGATLAPGVRFCGACGAPVATDATDAEATRVAAARTDDELTKFSQGDDEATRLAREADATRVAARSPFDDRDGVAPARVERLGVERDTHETMPRPRELQTTSREQQMTARQPQQMSRQPVSQAPARAGGADPDAERVIFSVRPTMLFVGLGYALAVLCAIGLTVLLAKFNLLPALYSVLVSLPLLLIPAYYHLRRNTLKYTLTDSKIEIDRGLIAKRTRNIPLRNIQDVTVAATIPQRLLGFGDLIIDNASELGGSTVMHNIPSPRRHADMLLRELRRWN
jgi:membrane protein YdbS with pleckstrin-like domain